MTAATLAACGEEDPARGDLGWPDGAVYPGEDAGWYPLPADGWSGGDGSFADGWSADGSSADGSSADGSGADGWSGDGSSGDGSADGAASDGGVGGIDWDDIFPPPPDGGAQPAPGDFKPLPDNLPECPPTAPDNPVGLCVGVPIYGFCGYTNGVSNYNCICDWYHWLCSPL